MEHRSWRRWGTSPCAILILVGFALLLVPASSPGAVTGSAHDFSGIADFLGFPQGEGVCAPCHKPHYSTETSGIWRRDLSQERSFFGEGNVPSGQNYALGDTLSCYDCHDDHGDVDDDPGSALFGLDLPQDAAFDDDMKTTAYGDWDGTGSSQPAGAKIGYFEDRYSGAAIFRRGGHYFKTDPDGGGPVAALDKLPCGDCHDPHDTSNQCFVTKTLGGNSGLTGLTASGKTRSGTGNGRAMCATCHGYAGDSAVSWSDVNSAYTAGGTITATPATVSGIVLTAHLSTNATPCVNCHPHQMIQTSCADCHGFPPLAAGTDPNWFDPVSRATTENYANGAGAHQRHKDAMGAKFTCDVCHGPNPGSDDWHNDGLGTVIQAQVDVVGQTLYWDPDDIYTGVYTGAASSEALPAGYEMVAKGGNDGAAGGRCAGVACHGNPPDTAGALNWTDRMYVDATTNDVAICWWCHDSDPAIWRIDASSKVYAPNMMGTRLYTHVPPYDGGADGTDYGANQTGHGRAGGTYYKTGNPAADKDCFVCHDATYTVGVGPVRPHFDDVVPTTTLTATAKRLWTTINGQPVSDNLMGDDSACEACHRSGGSGDQVTEAENIMSPHGNTGMATLPREAPFSRRCRQCHEPHGLTGNGQAAPNAVNLAMVDDRVDTTNDGQRNTGDRPVVFVNNVNPIDYGSTDNNSPYDGVCEACHTQTGIFIATGSAGNLTHATERCTSCHRHNPDTIMATVDGFMAKGGSNIDQFFDVLVTNYNDVSRHPLKRDGLTYAGQPNCLYCHYADPASAAQSNECLKCHVDNNVNQGSIAGGGSHMDGIIQLAAPASGSDGTPPNAVSVSVPMESPDQRQTAAYQAFCLGCHQASPPMTLGGLTPSDISAAYESYGHGKNAGGNYDCRRCHLSIVPTSGGTGNILNDFMPGFHGSINHWLVANVTSPYQTPEYPVGATVDLRGTSKDSWCITQCHGKAIVTHTWDKQAGAVPVKTDCPQSGGDMDDCQTHPSNAALPVNTHYKTANQIAFPLSEYKDPSVPLPGAGNSGNVICVTCHTPHAHPNSASWTDVDKQMLRASIAGTPTICLSCHQ